MYLLLLFLKLVIFCVCIEENGNEHQLLQSYDVDNQYSIGVNGTTVKKHFLEAEFSNISYKNSSTDVQVDANLLNATNSENDAVNTTRKSVACLEQNETNPVEIVNATRLLKLLTSDPNITSKDTPAHCVAVLFYGASCPFSSAAAASYNALPRVFSNIKMVAINAMKYHIFNAQNGIVGVPTLMLFHNGRAVAKYNETEYRIELLVKFIAKQIGVENVETLHYFVTSEDFRGPLASTPEEMPDVWLALADVFLCLCFLYFFSKSQLFHDIVEHMKHTWRLTAQHFEHEHTE